MKRLLLLAVVAGTTVVVSAQGLDPASITKPLGESWPTYSGDYTGRRYSSLTQINQANVKHMTLAWTRRLANGPGAPGPRPAGAPDLIVSGEADGSVTVAGATQIKGAILQVNGVLYVTTPDKIGRASCRERV